MADEIAPVRSTGIGSWPGQDLAEALRITFSECPELPYLPELPARGVGSGLVGRGTAVLSGLALDLQPAGWRLTGSPGRDQLRARAILRDDADQLEEAAQDYAGPFKIAIVGPWTLAASVERPRGDRILADHGGRRELAQSLAQGLAELITDLGRRLPGLELIIQLDEPLLPAVLAGAVPTASGFSRHRRVEPPELSEALSTVVDAVAAALPATQADDGATGRLPRIWLHSCAADVPVRLIKNAGIGGIAVDLDQVQVADWDAIGAAMSDGLWLGAGALPTDTGPATGRGWTPDPVAERVLRSVRALGLDPEVAARMVLSPACGLARFDQRSAVNALRAVRKAADIVTDQLPR
jgi:methionine synthase II (cobalamin-independent)